MLLEEYETWIFNWVCTIIELCVDEIKGKSVL